LLRALRERYPDAHISYLVEPPAAPIVLGNPHLDEVILAPRPRGAARIAADLRLGRALRQRRFDIVIDLHGGPRSAWLTWATGAPMRIGYAIPGRVWMYTHRVPRSPDLAPRHSVRTQWDLLAPLGIDGCDPVRYPMEMRTDRDADARIAARLGLAQIGTGHPIVVIHVSAGNAFRRWPAESFQTLVTRLARRDPARRIILTSGPSDASAAARIAERRARNWARSRRVSRNSASSTSRNFARSSVALRYTLVAIAARCTSPPPPRHRSSSCWAPRCRSGRIHGGIRDGTRRRSTSGSCRAVHAGSGRASRAITAA
jgi:ADP-heptose:LPS heptosyltransferase